MHDKLHLCVIVHGETDEYSCFWNLKFCRLHRLLICDYIWDWCNFDIMRMGQIAHRTKHDKGQNMETQVD